MDCSRGWRSDYQYLLHRSQYDDGFPDGRGVDWDCCEGSYCCREEKYGDNNDDDDDDAMYIGVEVDVK